MPSKIKQINAQPTISNKLWALFPSALSLEYVLSMTLSYYYINVDLSVCKTDSAEALSVFKTALLCQLFWREKS